MIKAVIDIGTNSSRLYVSRVEDGEQKKIIKMLSTTRLGEGILNSRSMLSEAMERTSNKVREFCLEAKKHGAEEIFIYATAVVREAENREEFKKQIFDKTGITLDVISGQIEGKIAFYGAIDGKSDCAVIDIGGGSTEVVTEQGGIFKALSQKTGGVRLKEKFSNDSGTCNVQEVKDFVKESYLPLYREKTDISDVKTLIGVSGTPTTLYSLFTGEKTYKPEIINGGVFSRRDMDMMLEKMAAMTTEERRDFSGEFKDRADIIVFGGCILSSFMEYYGFDEITVSDRDSLEGYLQLKLD